ncbi:alpha/beta fold hydrolase [Streptomyces sp. NBC_00525]|uniref:alpha/beta fold hydrolase n=1 Tax=Streptomyces sp. NBC_00525 TaxID=2903660 RepID=UPI002E801D5B|nr:alpha/beta hydrolase [Streptomyces sp. NBC_00525]WUC96752.1 alpha/beta hydrolase [Streptomyces sp. NBC_00525]
MDERSVVDVGDVRLAYRSWGASFGSPVVLLHDVGASSASWEAAGGLLGQEWRVYGIDLRGHGESDWPDEYDLELMRDDVLGFLDECELDRVGVVGHGMGGVVAHLLAQDHPDRVERLVLVETPPPFPGTAYPAASPNGPADYDEAVLASVGAELADPDPAWARGLGEIVAPTLLLAGGPGSEMPQGRLQDMASLIPDCHLVTMGGGHRPHETDPEQTAHRITEFFTS